MNTTKILDAVPQTTAVSGPPPATPPRPGPQSVPEIGNGTTADLIQQSAERQARAAAAEEERAAAKQQPLVQPPILDREVGLVGDTFEVFVDLVGPSNGTRFRIFGPPDNPGPLPPATPTTTPSGGSAAYTGTGPGPAKPTLTTDV